VRPLLVALASLLLAAAPAQAVRIDLIGYTPDAPVLGTCETPGTAVARLPADAQDVAPHEFNPVGGFLAGPVGFSDMTGFEPEYATISDFAAHQVEGALDATFTVTGTPRWCSGWTGDHTKEPPRPASEQPDAQSDPTYTPGWATMNRELLVDYVLERSALRSVDPKGRTRSRPPRALAVSRRSPLVARSLDWTRWGSQVAKARGTLRHDGRGYLVRVELYNPIMTGELEHPGCRADRLYYQNLAVTVPAWEAATTYRLNGRCSRSKVNNSGGDLRPPAR
jgi:hypothetical protein